MYNSVSVDLVFAGFSSECLPELSRSSDLVSHQCVLDKRHFGSLCCLCQIESGQGQILSHVALNMFMLHSLGPESVRPSRCAYLASRCLNDSLSREVQYSALISCTVLQFV